MMQTKDQRTRADFIRKLRPDWRAALEATHENLRLVVVGDHFPKVAFAYQDGDQMWGIAVPKAALRQPFEAALAEAVALFLAWLTRQAKAA